MFEIKVALKYLIPRRRSLSTALISAMSVFVISLVVWLVLVFLSVTKGIEQNWLAKLTSLYAPIRIQPTDTYYNSYYYQVDRFASASHFTYKTIGEKAVALLPDPFDEAVDAETPQREKLLLDPVKIAYKELQQLERSIPGFSFEDYEISGALLRLALHPAQEGQDRVTYLSQMSYLLSFAEKNPRLSSILLSKEGVLSQGRLPELEKAQPILLPKSYLDSGAKEGDRGSLSFVATTAVSSQEQQIPVEVVGFYDPGILSIGNRCILVPSEVTRTILAASHTFSPDGTPSNGIFAWVKDLSQVEGVRQEIMERFEKAGIASYWKVATFKEFEFSKDLLQQFQSDRTLFLIIAAIILIVACCNVISLLVLLVNDKKREIAILLSMGASFRSIAAIFGICGVSVGMVSCLFGTLAALLTLRNLGSLVALLSALQGRAAFNPLFFGQTLPSQFSFEALLFVLIATPLLSLAAGLIPALKASHIRPSSVLRAE